MIYEIDMVTGETITGGNDGITVIRNNYHPKASHRKQPEIGYRQPELQIITHTPSTEKVKQLPVDIASRDINDFLSEIAK